MHKGRKPNRTALPKLHKQENTCLRSFFDADEICAEYHKKTYADASAARLPA